MLKKKTIWCKKKASGDQQNISVKYKEQYKMYKNG